MSRCTFEHQHLAVALATYGRHLDATCAVQVIARQRVLLEHLVGSAFKHHVAALASGTGSDVHEVVRLQHHVAVVFHHDDRISDVAQFLQRLYQQLVVTLVQSYRRLVEDVEHVHQLRTYLRSQSDALRLAARKCHRRTVERKVSEANAKQELDACGNLLQYLSGNALLPFVQLRRQLVHPLGQVGDCHCAHLGNVLAVDEVMERLIVQTLSVAVGTGLHRAERLSPAAFLGRSIVTRGVLQILHQALIGHGHHRVAHRLFRHVVRLSGAAQHSLDGILGQGADGVVECAVVGLQQRLDLPEDHAFLLLAQRDDAAFSYRQRRVGDDLRPIHHRHRSQAMAMGTGAHGAIEREVVRRGFLVR